MDDAQIIAWIVDAWARGKKVGAKTLRKRFGVGYNRAVKLLKQAASGQPEAFLIGQGVDLERYEVERVLVNEWGQPGAKSQQIKVWLRNREPNIAEELRQALTKHSKVHRVEVPQGDTMAVLSIFDLHVGMLSWGKETGENYDTRIALQRLSEAASYLLAKLPKVSLIVIPIGNDILHADTHQNTTANGTRLDVDSRWQKAFIELASALINGPLSWAAEVAPVRIVIVPGNHDYQRAFYLGEVLRWYYTGRGLPVEVDNAPRLRKYLLWGDALLGFTHGHGVKLDQLPLIMASEAAKEWGQAKWREWLIGHYHARREYRYGHTFENGGVRVRVLPSLASHDAWHYEMGFTGRLPEASLLIYEAGRGWVSEHVYRPGFL